jgi:hypothetical protein
MKAEYDAARAAHGLPPETTLDFPAWVNGEPDDGETIDARGASIGAGLAQHLPGPDAA